MRAEGPGGTEPGDADGVQAEPLCENRLRVLPEEGERLVDLRRSPEELGGASGRDPGETG